MKRINLLQVLLGSALSSLLIACGVAQKYGPPTAGPTSTPTRTLRVGVISTWQVTPSATPDDHQSLSGDKGRITDVVYTLDGKMLIVSGYAGIMLYDAKMFSKTGFLETQFQVNGVDLTWDGSTLAAALEDGVVQLWNVGEGNLMYSTPPDGLGYSRQKVFFAPDDKTLVVARIHNCADLWRMDNGILSSDTELEDSCHFYVKDLIFTSDGKTAAIVSGYGPVRIFRLSDGKLVRMLKGKVGAELVYVPYAAFAPDGQALVTVTEDGVTQLWHMSDDAVRLSWTWHLEHWGPVAFAPDSQMLGMGLGDGTVSLWRVSDGVIVKRLTGVKGRIVDLTFAPDGQSIAVVSRTYGRNSIDGVWVWSVRDGTLTEIVQGE